MQANSLKKSPVPLPAPQARSAPGKQPRRVPVRQLLTEASADVSDARSAAASSTDVLGQEPHLAALRAVFDALARRLGRAVPELGRDTAGDVTALSARAKADPEAVRQEVEQALPQPSGGR